MSEYVENLKFGKIEIFGLYNPNNTSTNDVKKPQAPYISTNTEKLETLASVRNCLNCVQNCDDHGLLVYP